MKSSFWRFAILLLASIPTVASGQPDNYLPTGLPSRIAFGSCGHQDKPMPILDVVREQNPDLFIYLGDNIYGDTKDMKVLQAKYEKLGAKPEFQRLRAAVPTLSVWDDHDYGWNDAGKEYEFKEQSREIFFNFWKVPADSPRRTHSGIYGSHQFSENGRTLQIILLDTRTFRDPLKRNGKGDNKPAAESGFKNDYQPDADPQKTLLGDTQWTWLEGELKKPADLRIICSSIQFGHEYNGWESWTNLPNERKRMVDLIRSTGANGVIFISGDVHWGEISKRHEPNVYPMYDVTASGLTEEWYNVEPNKYRVGEATRENHFGLISIDWESQTPAVTMNIVDGKGTRRATEVVPLEKISRPAAAPSPAGDSNSKPAGELLANAKRVVFFGDSITFDGRYICHLDAWLRVNAADQSGNTHHPELINVGLPSENVTGLSEPIHPFPRPNVHERLARALEKLKPDLVVACYGINDGIYYPFDADRFSQYQSGMIKLVRDCKEAGADVILLTPPPFDSLPGEKRGSLLKQDAKEFSWKAIYEHYDTEVMAKYSTWVIENAEKIGADAVIDVRAPILEFTASQRVSNPDFVMSKDGIHIDGTGHRILATAIAEAAEIKITEKIPGDFFQSVSQLQDVRKLHWLSTTGHKRPGVRAGLKSDAFAKQSQELTSKIESAIKAALENRN